MLIITDSCTLLFIGFLLWSLFYTADWILNKLLTSGCGVTENIQETVVWKNHMYVKKFVIGWQKTIYRISNRLKKLVRHKPIINWRIIFVIYTAIQKFKINLHEIRITYRSQLFSIHILDVCLYYFKAEEIPVTICVAFFSNFVHVHMKRDSNISVNTFHSRKIYVDVREKTCVWKNIHSLIHIIT